MALYKFCIIIIIIIILKLDADEIPQSYYCQFLDKISLPS